MKNQFGNPIMPGADPFVLLHDGMYYMYCTMENAQPLVGHNNFPTAEGKQDGYHVYQSDDLLTWEDKGFCLKSQDVMGDKWFWAPEVLYRNGKFYMVYSSEEHLGIAVADSPLGPFRQEKKQWLFEENAIDGHFFVDDDGTVYLYYVKFPKGNVIFVAKMAEDLLHVDTFYPQPLIQAEEPWETVDCLVAEGPFVLKHKGLYYLTYSCNHTRCRDYAVGVAVSSSSVGPFAKSKKNPILHRNDKFCGVGHHSFTTSKDGKTLICSYHCHNSLDIFKPRRFCLNTAEFVPGEDGMDDLIIHGPQ